MSATVTEAYFWTQVKAGLKDSNTHLCRLENSAGSGVPDVNACSNGVESWIELKVFHGNFLHFRNSQRIWITERLSVGGRVFVLARNNDQLLLYRATEVLSAQSRPVGVDRKAFCIHLDDLPTPLYSCFKPFKWDEVRKRIFDLT